MKIFISFLIGFFITACGTKLVLPKEPLIKQNDLKDLNISYEWYKAYDNKHLNEFINYVLKNNSDVKVASLNLLSALARADLIDYDLYPSLSGNLGFTKNKNLNSGLESKNFNNALNLSYELDIYGKIRDSAKASEFSAKASEYDLQNLKISMVNTALNDVFELAYFNDMQNLLEQYFQNLTQMKELYTYKYKLGKIEELDLLNLEQNTLKAKQNLLSNEQNRNLLIKNLQDLLGKKEGFSYIEYFKTLSLSDFKELKPKFNIPLKTLAYRPDVQAKINNLKSAFKDYTSMQKSILPNISLGGILNGSDENFNDSFKFEILSGNIKISLPFLDYGRVRQNIKISEFEYDKLLVEYEQILQSAINEYELNYKDYQSNISLLKNLEIINAKQKLIKNAYYEKYNLGKSELKDYLDASNALNSSEEELLRAKFNLYKIINLYYQITAIGEIPF
ncbi:TolC family protein [Campylobacter molothri]|uniref:TolC family protein n=1 Tax=Campylobacter molothri TaxID=1032242 RepID=A0ACC5W2N5_9BACT|nr:TolC family protein [Campylobacter sp. W0067]MBZ7931745.1 TolC family protein [Campylobacter sp. RM12910]MBZ7933085.1 TolC family protein [Campylobacter sp. RM10543]MBZ7943387.1 TolC family protein [Campylobacter sp. RM13744]MBZ7946048.1 TolC family protein [Campylobacter sp. RM10536]MBZ7952707.1 TolC family protein [Campylobacter sp. RM9939]MBZ7957063.1 TolC family protein [Campylobacter sp. RM10541]MBZ7958607.1 TolC family protein [Campylobacter sp. RM9760]MBZ7960688.1 TolC family prot